MEETREALFKQAEELGISRDQVPGILKRNGVVGKYVQADHKRYLGILTNHSTMIGRLIKAANHEPDPMALPPIDACPICGMPVERDAHNDYLYGGVYGWKCTNPDQGKPSHFFQHRLEPIRKWMQRNQGMSDPETSSEMESEIECPSGEGPRESSSLSYSELPIESIGQLRTEEYALAT